MACDCRGHYYHYCDHLYERMKSIEALIKKLTEDFQKGQTEIQDFRKELKSQKNDIKGEDNSALDRLIEQHISKQLTANENTKGNQKDIKIIKGSNYNNQQNNNNNNNNNINADERNNTDDNDNTSTGHQQGRGVTIITDSNNSNKNNNNNNNNDNVYNDGRDQNKKDGNNDDNSDSLNFTLITGSNNDNTGNNNDNNNRNVFGAGSSSDTQERVIRLPTQDETKAQEDNTVKPTDHQNVTTDQSEWDNPNNATNSRNRRNIFNNAEIIFILFIVTLFILIIMPWLTTNDETQQFDQMKPNIKPFVCDVNPLRNGIVNNGQYKSNLCNVKDKFDCNSLEDNITHIMEINCYAKIEDTCSKDSRVLNSLPNQLKKLEREVLQNLNHMELLEIEIKQVKDSHQNNTQVIDKIEIQLEKLLDLYLKQQKEQDSTFKLLYHFIRFTLKALYTILIYSVDFCVLTLIIGTLTLCVYILLINDIIY